MLLYGEYDLLLLCYNRWASLRRWGGVWEARYDKSDESNETRFVHTGYSVALAYYCYYL